MPIPQNGQTHKQFIGKLQMNCLSVFDHFVKLGLKGLIALVLMKLTIFQSCFESF